MLHPFDSATNIIHHQQSSQQQQQQQQQQQHLRPVRSSAHFMAATANSSTSNGSAIQEVGFVQERYTHNHHQDSSHSPPSPLMLNPTIVPSQSSQYHLLSSVTHQEMHPHLVHPFSHQAPHQHQIQQQQQSLQHHRSVFHLQQQYQQHVQQQLRQDQQDLDEARGRSGSIEMGFQRKRSLSVPLLFSLNSGGLENDIHTQDRRQNQGQSGQDPDGDQDMDTDEVASPTSSAMATASGLSQGSNNNPSPSTALVYDYSKMTLQRESLLATLPRSHRHRAYASSIAKGPQPSSHSRHTLYYSGNNHPHAFYRNQYNPFTNRKFPPYQYWAVSAQRDYHLSTIGVLASPSGVRSGAISSSSSSSAPGSGGEGGTGDLFLRAALGGSGGGVNKSVYRSRLPVHLRHITSRNNRRPAVCLSAFPSGEGRDEGNIDNSRDMKRHSTSILPSSSSSETSTGRASSMTLLVPGTDQRSPFQVSHTSSTSSSLSSSSSEPESTSISPSKTAARERGDSSPSSLGRESLSAANRKKLSDWKRATALSFDQDSDPQRTGMVMRLASNDPSSITTTSSASSSSAVLRGNSSAGRQWLSQRGGLANLFQNNLSIHGSGSSEGGSGSGPSGSTVDRLVEEMTKWSV